MVDLIYCEILKLKRSKILLISILGSMAAPFMEYVGYLKNKIDQPELMVTYKDFFDETNLYVLLLFGLIVYGVIAAYLFSREYSESTLKLIISIPVSKRKFIISKFLMFYLWVILLTFLTWFSTFIIGIISGAADFSWKMIFISFCQFLLGGTLAFLSLTPFIFMTLWFKNIVPTVISLAAIVMFNAALSNESLSVFFPWSGPFLIISKGTIPYGYSPTIPIISVLLVSTIGFIGSIIYFIKSDIK